MAPCSFRVCMLHRVCWFVTKRGYSEVPLLSRTSTHWSKTKQPHVLLTLRLLQRSDQCCLVLQQVALVSQCQKKLLLQALFPLYIVTDHLHLHKNVSTSTIAIESKCQTILVLPLLQASLPLLQASMPLHQVIPQPHSTKNAARKNLHNGSWAGTHPKKTSDRYSLCSH